MTKVTKVVTDARYWLGMFIVSMVLAVVSACGTTGVDGDGDVSDIEWYQQNTTEFEMHLRDGRTVTCLAVYTDGGVDCDWENAE